MGTYRKLSRLLITGNISEHTPLCVLMEIADAHGVHYGQKDIDDIQFSYHLFKKINETAIKSIDENIINSNFNGQNMGDLEFIGRFVNKYQKWTYSLLRRSYNYLLEFVDNNNPLNKIPINFTVGLQTPQNPESINACVLYKICVCHRISVNSRTTIHQMTNAVKMLRAPIDSVLRKARKFLDHHAKLPDIISILALSSCEIEDTEYNDLESNGLGILSLESINYNDYPKLNNSKVEISHELLIGLHTSLHNISNLQQRIDPTTSGGCIALAAINYHIDISKSSVPLNEYKILQVAGRSNYHPVDSWMSHWYKKNPTLFDLTVSFNPIFPSQYYNVNSLINMACTEGYTSEEVSRDTPYELLQLAYVGETFYQGEIPNIKNRETIISLCDIEEIPYGQLLSFGSRDGIIKIISIEELITLFENNQNFSNPFQIDTIFSNTAINKLKLIAQNPSGPIPNITLSEPTITMRTKLLETINNLEILVSNKDYPTRQFCLTYRNSNPDTKASIRCTLNNLLYLGMYMRGWMGSGQYPVSNAIVPTERESQVSINVTEAIAKYEASCRALGRIGTQINNLPLVKYKEKEYQPSILSEDGLTIGERIEIVKQGERTSNVSSCIRLSSNWICSSAHKYITAIGIASPFDIFYLRHIS